jgi:hypothetical protein
VEDFFNEIADDIKDLIGELTLRVTIVRVHNTEEIVMIERLRNIEREEKFICYFVNLRVLLTKLSF